ncbi:pentapeptide repeat-containing protein [Bradyrhizobium erythrophlei]|uniref:pentapeptide repeat-containing protein n=1 Tax=Bradyrhizobium erythrophlei TaxID=1437360 RepID=UPI0015602913|nr:pentapeptide repeat-containing protein [Bradyrhizobium erythrophlei]
MKQDFSQADLSATEADRILLQHSSFNGAKFDGCRWTRPVFAHADMARISTKAVEWGTPGDRDSDDRVAADFSHARLTHADLTKAQICGFFYGSDLRNTSLVEADLSFSDFVGPNFSFDMSFGGARMRGAKLRHCRISNASFYSSDCRNTDFFGTQFSDVSVDGCDLSHAHFENAEIELTMFSPDQMQQAELSAAYDVDKLGLVQIGNRSVD